MPPPIEFEQRLKPASIDIQYLNLLNDVLNNGTESTDRTGVGTRKVFGRMLQVDLEDGFPLLTTKRVPFKAVAKELLWFISGETNIKPLVDQNVHIWDEWPFQYWLKQNGLEESHPKYTESWEEEKKKFIEKIKSDPEFAITHGDLGPVYGFQWRHWKNPDGTEIDQLLEAVNTLKTNPDSRRIIVNAWNPSDIEGMSVSGLPPCHLLYQFQVSNGRANCALYQRSVDTFLGLPFNIASYGLLTSIVANNIGLRPGELTLFLGDTHIYTNHEKQVRKQLERDPKTLPKLRIEGKIEDIDNINLENIKIEDYDPHPPIPAPIAV